jgi:hypothetical protein
MSDTSKREELIEAARLAFVEAWEAKDRMIRAPWRNVENPPLAPKGTRTRAGIIAAFAVFEKAHTPADDERTWVTGFLLGCGVAPDRAEEYAGKLLAAGFRRTAVQEPSECLDCGRTDGGCDRVVEPQGEPTLTESQARAVTTVHAIAQSTGMTVSQVVETVNSIGRQGEPTDAQVMAASLALDGQIAFELIRAALTAAYETKGEER